MPPVTRIWSPPVIMTDRNVRVILYGPAHEPVKFGEQSREDFRFVTLLERLVLVITHDNENDLCYGDSGVVLNSLPIQPSEGRTMSRARCAIVRRVDIRPVADCVTPVSVSK